MATPKKGTKSGKGIAALLDKEPEQTNDAQLQTGIINIDLDNITADPNQPRRFFNQEQLEELGQSIIQYGCTSPILVRPNDGTYMIVFGERRYRASLLARTAQQKIRTIPAMVRELTDDEALELQITENLQRHDPHPMEEAASFERMRQKQDVKEIAVRIGKSVKFVANRLLLNNLLPDFQEMFFRGCCDMQGALMIAKVDKEIQTALLKELVRSRDWRKDENFQISNIEWYLRDKHKDLDKAPFKTENADLYPEAGACNKCSRNSINTLLLFTEEESRICSNPVCYKIKSDLSYKESIAEVMTSPDIIFVAPGYLDQKQTAKVDEVKKLGAVVLAGNDWDKVRVEEKPVFTSDLEKPEWDTYLAERKEEWDYKLENISEKKFLKIVTEEFEEAINDWESEVKEEQDDFKMQIEEWEAEQQEMETARQEGRIKKAFVIAGYDEGKIIEVIQTERGANKVAAGGGEGADSVAKIMDREARAKELDGEKVWVKIGELIKQAPVVMKFESDRPLTENELRATCMAMVEAISAGSDFYKDVFGLDRVYGNNLKIAKAIEVASEKQLMIYHNRLCRQMLRCKLFSFGFSHLVSNERYWGMKVAEEYAHDPVAIIQLEQKEIADKRAARVKERIAELKKDKK